MSNFITVNDSTFVTVPGISFVNDYIASITAWVPTGKQLKII